MKKFNNPDYIIIMINEKIAVEKNIAPLKVK